MIVLVLAEDWDPGAAAVARAVAARRGPGSVVTLAPRRLAAAQRWVHTVSTHGVGATEILTANGVRLAPGAVGAVLNRIDGLPPVRFARSSPRDRDYAAMELQALLVSWLAGLPALNPMNGNGSARLRPRFGWLVAAARAGLPVVQAARTTSVREWPAPAQDDAVPAGDVLVVGHRVFGPLAGRFGDGCVEVARATGCPLLAFRFVRTDLGTVLTEVDPQPDLLDSAAVDAVADHLVEAL